MSKIIDPRSASIQAFFPSGKGSSLEARHILNHLDGKTPAQRAAVLDKKSPEHAALLAYLTLKLGHPVERIDMEMLKAVKDLTL